MKIDKNKGYDVDDDILSLGSEGAQVSDYAFNRRWFNIIWLIISSVIFLLITKVFYISVINHNKYVSKASGNILHTSPIIAPRGRIFSNDKKILVDNIPNYSATILYEYVEDDCKSFVNEI